MAHSLLAMPVDVGHVLFMFGRSYDGGRIIQHVMLVARPGTFDTDETLWVRDWPPSDPDSSKRRLSGDLDSGIHEIEVDLNKMVVGWIGVQEHELGFDIEILDATARDILRATAYSWTGGIIDILYDVFPARMRPYFLDVNGQTIEYPFKGSCVGFVEECFEFAGPDIVAEDNLPIWPWRDLEKLGSIMGIPQPAMDRLDAKKTTYLDGIPVLLPGYQLRAFIECNYPRTPTSTDEALAIPAQTTK